MTVTDAKLLFAHWMKISRERKLLPKERAELRTASQVIRHSQRKTAAHNKVPRSSRTRHALRKKNPNKMVLIYDHVTRIEATKGTRSLYPKQKFFHNFKRPYPKMYGLPDGSLLIK